VSLEREENASDLSVLDSGGVDEVSVIPWSLLLRRKLVQRVGVSRRKATLIVLLSCVFTVSFMITLLVVSLKTVADDLNSTTGIISWAITAPMLAFGVVGPAFGKVGDLWGHKRVFVWGLFVAGNFCSEHSFCVECDINDYFSHTLGSWGLGAWPGGDGVYKPHV